MAVMMEWLTMILKLNLELNTIYMIIAPVDHFTEFLGHSEHMDEYKGFYIILNFIYSILYFFYCFKIYLYCTLMCFFSSVVTVIKSPLKHKASKYSIVRGYILLIFLLAYFSLTVAKHVRGACGRWIHHASRTDHRGWRYDQTGVATLCDARLPVHHPSSTWADFGNSCK